MSVATRVAEGRLREQRTTDPQDLKLALRAAGVPHVWEQIWSLIGAQLDHQDAAHRIDSWLGQAKPEGELRCGVGVARSNGQEAIVVISVDAVGDLARLPTRARLGQWLSVDAQLLLPTSDARVVVMGPTGMPRALLTSPPHDNRVRAQVSLDQPGAWVIQVLSVHQHGPRPALEAMVFVDSEPFTELGRHAVPGEDAGQGAPDASSALVNMTNRARKAAGLESLTRDPDLDRLAEEHAGAMMAAQRVAHDLGAGGPEQRLQGAGLSAVVVGENLAFAQNPVNAHRALWASPAHRSGILEARFASIGVGVVEDKDNRSIWVCELFANFGSTGKIPLTR